MINTGKGLNLENNLKSLSDGHTAFNVQICQPLHAIKVKLGVDGQVYVTSGHSTLG